MLNNHESTKRFNVSLLFYSPMKSVIFFYLYLYLNYCVVQLYQQYCSGIVFHLLIHFSFMLPCIVIDLFLNNQPDAQINQNLFCYKTPNVSGLLLHIIRSFQAVRMELQFHPDSAWKRSSNTCMKLASAECTVQNSWWWVNGSILTLLGNGHQKPAWNQCRMYSRELLMMGREDARNT